MIVALALASLVLLLGLLSLRPGQKSGRSHGLALVLQMQLDQAREKALRDHVPVAIMLPSAGGSAPHSQGLYVLEGEELPRLTRRLDYSSEFRGAAFFVGTWPLDGSRLRDPSLTTQLAGGVSARKSLALRADDWLPASAKTDYAFIFQPDGSLVTNDLPSYDGDYHIAVGTGFGFSGAGPPPGTATMAPGPAYYALNEAAHPWTVVVSSVGLTAVVPGIPAGPAVVLSDSASWGAASPALPPPMAGPGANQPPIVADPVVTPDPNPATLPPTAQATVTLEGYLTLELRATDPDGDKLYCTWNADGGTFSSNGEVPMRWDPAARNWVAIWEWRPPGAAIPGNVFTLTYRVRDAQGAVSTPVGAAIKNIEVLASGRIFFETWPSVGRVVNVMNIDGTGARSLGDPAPDDYYISLSPDGTMIVCSTHRYTGPPPGTGELIWFSSDMTNPRRLTTNTGWDLGASLSPAKTRIAWISNYFGGFTGAFQDYDLQSINLDGTGRVRLSADIDLDQRVHYPPMGTNNGELASRTTWSPDGTRVAFARYTGAGWDIHSVLADGSGGEIRLTSGGNNWGPCWSPDATDPWIYFTSDRDGDLELYRVRPDGTGETRLTNDPVDQNHVSVSPDGQFIVYDQSYEIWRRRADGTQPIQLHAPGTTPGWTL